MDVISIEKNSKPLVAVFFFFFFLSWLVAVFWKEGTVHEINH